MCDSIFTKGQVNNIHNLLDCPSGYTSYGDYCYIVFPPDVSKDNAESACANNISGGHLAWISSSNENNFVSNLLNE